METKLVDKYGCIVPLAIWFALGLYLFKSDYTDLYFINEFKKEVLVIDTIVLVEDPSLDAFTYIAYLEPIKGVERIKRLDLQHSKGFRAYKERDTVEVWCRDDSMTCYASRKEDELVRYGSYYTNLVVFSSVFMLPLLLLLTRKLFK